MPLRTGRPAPRPRADQRTLADYGWALVLVLGTLAAVIVLALTGVAERVAAGCERSAERAESTAPQSCE